MSLIISYSGLRGIVGETLDEAVAFRYARAFGRLVAARHARPTCVIGRDTRASGPALLGAIAAGLAPFSRVVDLGIVATPTLQCALEVLGAEAGVCITASHNPAQWNGMKFFAGPANTVLDGAETKQLIAAAAAETEVYRPGASTLEPPEAHARAVSGHVARVLAEVDVARIRARAFEVALESGRGAGEEGARLLLEGLGCSVHSVLSARESEPVPEALGDLARAVVEHGCDVGFAQDLDADRLALCTETGALPGEDATLVLAIDHLLERQPAAVVVTNTQTTRALSDVAARHGARLEEVPVGEINLSRRLRAHLDAGRIAFGGEGNGGVIFPPVALGRDSLSGMALVLEALSGSEDPLSRRLAALPRYHARKIKLPLRSPETLYAALSAAFSDAAPDRSDGLKLCFSDGAWLSLRPSNTEPIMRFVAEAPSPERLDAIIAAVLARAGAS